MLALRFGTGRLSKGKTVGGSEAVPGHAQPAYSEETVEDEEEDCSGDTTSCAARITIVQMRARARENCHGESLTGGAEEHELPPSELLDREDSHPRGHEVFCSVAGGEETTQKAGKANALEDCGGVVAIEGNIVSL